MKTAYQYIRCAATDQAQQQLKRQQLTNADFAKNNNIQIVETFTDLGFSGSNLARPGWKQMADSLKETNEKVDFILVADLHRIFRGLIAPHFYNQIEVDLRVKIVSASGELHNILDTLEG